MSEVERTGVGAGLTAQLARELHALLRNGKEIPYADSEEQRFYELIVTRWLEASRRESAALLRRVSDGRAEYARGALDRQCEHLEIESNALEIAARIVEGDRRSLLGMLPSWRWTDAEVSDA